MARTYAVAVVALAVGAPRKWVENLLAQHDLPGVSRSRRGVERQVSDTGLLVIAITHSLHAELSMTVRRAAAVATELVGGDAGVVSIGRGVSLRLDQNEAGATLRHAVVAAMEGAVRVPRGRPRKG